MPSNLTPLVQEWTLLQENHERYEHGSLLIKLVAVLLCGLGLALGWHAALVVVLLPLLWLQEGIYRTSQSRLGARIIGVEAHIRQGGADGREACQLHTNWQAGRAGVLGLLAEYAGNAARPTVAFPYFVLLLIVAGWQFVL